MDLHISRIRQSGLFLATKKAIGLKSCNDGASALERNNESETNNKANAPKIVLAELTSHTQPFQCRRQHFLRPKEFRGYNTITNEPLCLEFWPLLDN